MQFDRHFTLAEANALLPWVRGIFAKIHHCLQLLHDPPPAGGIASLLPATAQAPAPNGHNGHNGHNGTNGHAKPSQPGELPTGTSLLAAALDAALHLPLNDQFQFDPKSAEERRLIEIWRLLGDEQRLELINGLLGALTDRGIVLQDVGRGLIDFPARVGDDEVLLCYELSDGAEIVAWHGLAAGYAGRRPIHELPQG